MQTFCIFWLKKSSMALFVMPGFIGWARLHGRKYVDKTRMIAPSRDNFFVMLLFSEVLATDEFNLQPMLLSQPFSVHSNLFPKWFRPLGIVEDPYALGLQETGHSPSIADTRNSARNDNAVEAGKISTYFRSVTVSEKLRKLFPRCRFEPLFAYALTIVN